MQAIVSDPETIGEFVLHRDGDTTPVLIRDVAKVSIAPLTRQGAVTRDDRGEAVTGLVMMLMNSREVVNNANSRLTETAPTLPRGVTLERIYGRSA